MKKMLFALLLLLMPVMTKATGQIAERLLMNGVCWQLYYCPIETNTTLSEDIARVLDSLPKTMFLDGVEYEQFKSTALWRNYVGTWEIKGNRLFLQKLEIPYAREVENGFEEYYYPLGEDILKEIFATYCTVEGICASWFCDTIRAATGEEICYEHMGFARHNEYECLIVVNNGIVKEMTRYDNYHKEGVVPYDVCKALAEKFPWEKFSKNKDTCFFLWLSDCVIDGNGTLQDCNVQCIRPQKYESMTQESPLIMAVKDILKDLKPWPVWYINGKFETKYLNWTFPLKRGAKVPDDKLGNLRKWTD